MTSPWTKDGLRTIGDIARRHGFSDDAGLAMAGAIAAGQGAMAQFGHPDLGGMGQWSQGGMLMIGDMFNNGLKSRVSALADDLAGAWRRGDISTQPVVRDEDGRASGFGSFAPWWPSEFGSPSSSGAQNGQRYAVFPDARRLAIERDGRLTVYDTGDHRIGGVSQQQGPSWSLTFSSDHGTVDAEDLREVRSDVSEPGASPSEAESVEAPAGRGDAGARSAASSHNAPPSAPARGETVFNAMPYDVSSVHVEASDPHASDRRAAGAPAADRRDPLELIRKLAELRDAGVLTDQEFSAKKTELLARL
jgi:hypothetical protein